MNPFSRNFDEEGRKAALDAEAARRAAPGHVLTDEQLTGLLAAARAEGHAEGHEAGVLAGRNQAMEEADVLAAGAMAPLTSALAELIAGRDEYRAAVLRDMGGFLRGLAAQLLPHIEERFGPETLMAEIDKISRRAIGPERVRIRVAPEIMPSVRRRLLAALEYDEERMSRFILTPDEKLGPLEVTAQWPSGGSDYSFRRLTNAIKDMIDGVGAEPPSP